MKLTRRQILVASAVGSVVAVNAPAQAPAAATAGTGQTDSDKIRQNAEALEKFTIPITTEPAFQFKA